MHQHPDASLSLSLSWRGWLSSRFEFRRGAAKSPGSGRREGHPRALRDSPLGVPASVAGALLCVLAVGLAWGGAEALALETHVPSGSFGGVGASALSGPVGVAVNDETGDVYVVDKGHSRVEEFDATGGTVLGEFDGASAGHALSAPEWIAVDNSTNPLDPSRGDVYVTDSGLHVVEKFTSAGVYLGELTETTGGAQFEELDGVAVDSNGVVWVYQGNAANGLIDSFSDAASNAFTGEIVSPYGASPGFAVDGEDNLYVNRGVSVFAKLSSTGTSLNAEVGPEEAGSSTAAAVDTTSGEVFIGSTQSVGTYEPSGGFLARFGQETLTGGRGVTVNPSDGTVYVADDAASVVDVFTPALVPDVKTAGASGVQATNATLNGTVDPDGVPVTSCVFEYGPTTSYGQSAVCESNPGSGSSAVAVSAEVQGLQEGSTYHYRLRAANAGGTAAGEDQTLVTTAKPSIDGQFTGAVTQIAGTLHAQIDPHGLATTYHFEYGATTAYGTSVPVPDGNLAAGNEDDEVSSELEGLQAGKTYHYRTVAVNSLGTTTSGDAMFTTEPPLQIDSVTAHDITATGAILQAQINPRGSDTSYRFEYGASTSYGVSIPIPDKDIGAVASDVSVSQQVTGLVADTTYHYRVSAHNALGTQTSADHTFIYTAGDIGLPDSRAYEMVTPPHKNGALFGQIFFGLGPDIAEDGSRIILPTLQCFGDATSCLADDGLVGTPYEFARTSGGWKTSSLAPSATQVALNGTWQVSASADTVLMLMRPNSSEGGWYARRSDGSLLEIGPVPLNDAGSDLTVDVSFSSEDATADLSHIVYTSSPAWPFDATQPSLGNSLYEYAGIGNTKPVLVGVSGGRGSTDLISACGTVLGSKISGVGGALSEDGRTVFFTAQPCASGSGANTGVEVPKLELFARIDGSRTVPISARSSFECTNVSGCASSPIGDASFNGASSDGSKVFFLDTQQLTDSASEDSRSSDTASQCSGAVGMNGCNLYEYDFNNPTGRNLIAVSAGGDSSGGGPRVQKVMTISADGSHVYFIAKGVLTTVPNNQGASPLAGANNLYGFERDARYPTGHILFVASLPDTDEGGAPAEYADITPDGRFLVFMSHGRLTQDDSSTSGAVQVFRYDAQTAQLMRVSIGNDGFNDNGNAGVGNAQIARLEISRHLGSAVRGPTMSDDGSFVFFESPVGLTPDALNDALINTEGVREGSSGLEYAENVYEYHDGHVYLISDGRDVSRSLSEFCRDESSVCLLGTDASGRNVFFSTADRLSPSDTDTGVDVYDAHICSSGEPCVTSAPAAPVPCQGEACHGGSAAVPSVTGAGTTVFSGPGNLTPITPVVKAKAKKRKVKAKKKAGRRRSKRRAGKANRHVQPSRKGV